MYKLLLCLRYLRTRYLAFVCIVSVMLGVATLIVVNSVMSGFSNKLKDRLHGILADVVVETERTDGFEERHEVLTERLLASRAGHAIEAISPTVEYFALVQFQLRNKSGQLVPYTKQVRVVGVDPVKHAKVGRFSDYLLRQKDAVTPSFDLTVDARDRFERNRLFADWEADPKPPQGQLGVGNNSVTAKEKADRKDEDFMKMPSLASDIPQVILPPPQFPTLPPARYPGLILGYSIGHFRYGMNPETGQPHEVALIRPGDDVFLATVGATGLKPVSMTFVVADFFKSEMSEYDSSFVYVPLEDLQKLRGMDDGRVSSLQIRLKKEFANDPRFVHDVFIPEVQNMFSPGEARVASWQQNQGPLLDAIDIERGILNLLLFMIVGVAGFGVLAIFSMIVSEKTRDIGVLKSLGASDRGIASVFIIYGLLLGLVGCTLGTVSGLLITKYINEIESFLSYATGHQVFDRKIYYFDKIPTNIEVLTVILVNLGAILVAILSSVLPAIRAARLHPVRALRFE